MAALTTTALVALTAAGTAMSAVNASKQGKYAAGVAGQNAELARRQAEDALERGKEEEFRHIGQQKRLSGTQRVRLASQGVEMDSGSALDVQLESDELSEMDKVTIRQNAAREVFGYQSQATQYDQQRKAIKSQTKMAVGQTLLNGAVNVAGIGYQSGWFGGKK